MKQTAIGIILGILIVTTLSVTVNQAKSSRSFGGHPDTGIHLIVPAKPTATVYVKGTDEMYKYIKKGYQVQQALDCGAYTPMNHYFLMVKY